MDQQSEDKGRNNEVEPLEGIDIPVISGLVENEAEVEEDAAANKSNSFSDSVDEIASSIIGKITFVSHNRKQTRQNTNGVADDGISGQAAD